jgi:hypothetical protein
MVLAELSGGIPEGFQRLRNRDVAGLEASVGAGNSNLRETGTLVDWPVINVDRPAVQLFSA